MGKDSTVTITGIGDADGEPYAKADLVKACRLDNSFAISFYQFDYQAVVNAIEAGSPPTSAKASLIPVAKVVLDRAAVDRMVLEMATLIKAVNGSEGT